EDGVAIPQPKLGPESSSTLFANVLGDGATALPVLEEDVAQARLTLALRPGVHPVAEGTADRLGARLVPGGNGPYFDLGIDLDLARKDLEAGAGKMLGDRLNFDRIAQVRLVGAVFADR